MARGTSKRKTGTDGLERIVDGVTAKSDDASDGGNADAETPGAIDPAAVAATTPGEQPIGDGEPQPARRRGRPPGSGAGSSRKEKVSGLVNVSGVEKLLVGIHVGLFALSGRPEWLLDTSEKSFDGYTESEFLAKSIKDVAQHYGAGLLDQKTLDWINLSICLGTVYGGRIFAIRSAPRVKPQRQPTPQETATVHNPNRATRPPPNDFSPHMNGAKTPANRADIAGIGIVDLPDDHPLSPNYKPRTH